MIRRRYSTCACRLPIACGTTIVLWPSDGVLPRRRTHRLARVDANSTNHGRGLRGGTFRLKRNGDAVRIELHHVRWTRDVAVSGRIVRSSRRHGKVRAFLRVSTPEDPIGRLTVQWPEGVESSQARVRGAFGIRKVVAESPAP
ncbi:MAG TPA: hypothetical protein VN325_08690 [Steroidobacteraceae bacterium]|nr:hypothetical protein [Steroidobacteraceae bacterium]